MTGADHVTTFDALDLAQVPLPGLLDDLRSAHQLVDDALAEVPPSDVATPADGWGARETVAHLAQGEELAALAVERPDEFRTELGRLLEDLGETLRQFEQWARAAAIPDLTDRWREIRERLVTAMTGLDASDRIPWVTGEMSAGSFARSRLMEAWAHGLDIADGVGMVREERDEVVRHVVYLGIRTHGFCFRNRGLEVPTTPFRVQLTAPSGADWVHGDPDAPECVSGTAFDFAAVVTQRRHPDDTGLVVEGEGVRSWLAIAQCFAGPATDHRPAGTFVGGRWVH